MLKIKDGPYGARLSPVAAIVAMFIVVDQAMNELGLTYELTSGLEGEHMPGSLHYVGMAHDWTVRTSSPYPHSRENELHTLVTLNLGQDFDVVWKADKRRLHVEYQPKTSLGNHLS